MFSENILSRKPFKFVMVLVKLVAYFSVPHAIQKSFVSPLMFGCGSSDLVLKLESQFE